MKKFVACTLAGMLCFAFVACGGKSSSPNDGLLPDEVANKDALDFYECNDDVVGERVYVADIELFYECDGERWFKSYDQTRSSSSTATSESKETDKENSSSSRERRNSSSSKTTSEDICASEMDFDESDEWIDGKTVFPAGTFDCSTYDCLSTDPLNPDITYGEMLDERDNQVYKVLRIGRHVWFAQNLNFKTDSSSESEEYLGRNYNWCDVMDLPSNKCGYKIYSNISDVNHQGICPDGWHVPNKKETIGLFCVLGASSLNYKISSKVSTDFTSDSTNMSGFSVVYDAGWVHFVTSTEYDEQYPWSWIWCLGWGDYADVFPEPEDRVVAGLKNLWMVRCVRNEENNEVADLLPTCDADHEGLVTPKDTMHFICRDGLWWRATDNERNTYGETCTSSEFGKVIKGHYHEDKSYGCSKNGWLDMTFWSWDLPKEIWLNPDKEYGSFVDNRDGKVYKTIKIEGKTWMAENLNYADSVSTPSLRGNTRCYDDIDEHCDVGGRLYTWAAAIDSVALAADANNPLNACDGDTTCLRSALVRGICPEGWHLPNYRVWDDFTWYAYILRTRYGWSGGPRMCTINVDLSKIDGIGFSALPVGYYSTYIEDFKNDGAYFWSSTESDSLYAYSYNVTTCEGYDAFWNHYKDDALSIRCIKDEDAD